MSLTTKNHLSMVLQTVKKLLSLKADKTELATKIDRSEMDLKADKSELSLKADKTELDLKADREELSLKADKTELTNFALDSVADWNQNDSEASNYIKNRPFYTENGLVTVQEEITITLDENGAGYYDGSWYPNEGVLYTVVWDGIEYISEPTYNDSDACGRFNVTINGERVNFYEAHTIYGTPAMAGEHTFKVCQEQEIAHAIDMKYLPDVATKSEVLDKTEVKMNKLDPVGTGSFSMNRFGGSAVGNYSSAIGYGAVANRLSESVIGRFNSYDTSVYGISEGSRGADFKGNDEQISCSDSYSFDEKTGEFTLNNPTIVNGKDLATGKYYIYRNNLKQWLRLVTDNSADGYRRKISHITYTAVDPRISKGAYLHTVGNGISDSERSNAHTLDWDGNAWYQGDVYVGSTSGTNMDEGSKKLATEEYVDAAIGGIEIPEGGNVELDTDLTETGKAADAKAVGDKFAQHEAVTEGMKSDIKTVSDLVGNKSVSEQISDALADFDVSAEIYTQNEEPVDAPEGALWIDMDEMSVSNSSGGASINMGNAAVDLLITILRQAVYTSDQSANINTLKTLLASGNSGENGGSGDNGESDDGNTETKTYTVTNNLTNITNSNSNTTVSENDIYVATLTANDGHSINSVVITMNGDDVTSSVYNNGVISIPAVTGDIVITAIATTTTVQTEELTKVWTTSYPDLTKFEYTESATPTGGQSYQCTKRNTIAGGLIKVDYDPTIVNKFDMNIYIFDADGQPYKHSYDEGSHFGNNTSILWGDPGSGAGFCNVYAPFELQLEEGCTFIACFRRGNFCEVLSDTVTNTNAGVAQWIRENVKITVTG